jgi:hypothetical protein
MRWAGKTLSSVNRRQFGGHLVVNPAASRRTEGENAARLNSKIGVEHGGFEPPTPCLPGKCSPAELMPRDMGV